MLARLSTALAICILLTSCPWPAKPGPGGTEVLRKVEISRTKYPLMPIKEDAERLGDLRSDYLARIGYPANEPDPDVRLKAYRQLEAMRKAQGIVHVSAGYCSPRDRDKQQCTSGPGGPGDPGGPGSPGGRDANGCAWSSVGPTNINGRITGIAIDPANHLRVFATTVGGIWRSGDGGRTWQRVSDDFLATVFGSIVVNGSEVVAGGGDPNYAGPGNGIWRSTSSGDPGSWSKLATTAFDNQVVFRLRVDPASGDIYAASSAGVFIGTHGGVGLSFARLDGFDAYTNDMVVDFSVSPRVVYAGVVGASASFARGIWKHGAGGWQEKDTGITTGNIARIALGLAASSPNTLYAKIANPQGRLVDVFKTTTGGEPPGGGGNAWTGLGAAVLDDSIFPGGARGYSWYNSVLEVDPGDPQRVYAGGLNIYRSTNGSTFVAVNGGADATWTYGPHSDQHAIAFDPVNPRIVWLGGDGGISRTSDTSNPTWRWTDVSHGMVITEYYRLASQQAMASLRAGGAQDNGTEITWGNRTWYQPGGCDGATVAIDASNPDTLYGNCNGGLSEFVNPVPGWSAGPATIPWSTPAEPPGNDDANYRPIDPLITDAGVARAALAQGTAPVHTTGSPPVTARTGPPVLLKTTDGVSWSQANASAPLGLHQDITTIAVAPSSAFQTYYLGVANGGPAAIWTTSNGGTLWNTAPTGVPDLSPNRIVVDNTNPLRAFAAFGGNAGGGVWMTVNGTAWSPLAGSGATAWPAGASATAIVIDPSDVHTLYVASNLGVFKGTLGGSPTTAAWTPYDEGLPDGLNVTDIAVGRESGLLSISTMGHGAFQRDIRPDVACRAKTLLVRDNVYDRGVGPSPSGVADPEHPVPDPAHPGFWKPDDSDAGKVYWWSSTDIRIDVPSVDPPANTISGADHVEAETCPIEMASCPSGTIWDNHPVRGQAANAYVQVSNPGLEPVQNVRVIALYADATSGLPDLPADFWSTTFPAGSTACGPLTPGSGWSLVDPAQPCKLIPVVNPAVPETAKFAWSVPASSADHTCMFTIAESTDDPLDPAIRSTNERRTWVLIPANRQIANRNLHVVNVDSSSPGGSSGSTGGGLPCPQGKDATQAPLTLSVSRAGMPKDSRLGLLLPLGAKPSGQGVHPTRATLDEKTAAEARRNGLDPSVLWTLDGDEAQLAGIPGCQGKPGSKLQFVYDLGSVSKGSTWRFSAISRLGSRVVGGSTYYLRVK
jgi:hypothetical protein